MNPENQIEERKNQCYYTFLGSVIMNGPLFSWRHILRIHADSTEGIPQLDQPLAATTPEIFVQRGLAYKAEDEDNIYNLHGNSGLGIDSGSDSWAASTNPGPRMLLFAFSPSMHACFKW